jgi:outer membrane biosynthesis protein TonB
VKENIEHRKVEVSQEIDQTYEQLASHKGKQQALDAELQALLAERSHYSLLSEISERLDQLHNEGGAQLFWGDDYDTAKASKLTEQARNKVIDFDSRVAELQQRYDDGEENIQSLAARVNILNEQSLELEEYEEEARNEYVVEREMDELPFRPMVMPWMDDEEDKRRLRRALAASLLVAILLGLLIPLWDIPMPDRLEPVKIPERMAQLIVEKKPPPPPPPPKVEKKLEESTKEKKVKKKAPEPETKKTQVARKKAERAGLLAFKNNFSELIDSGPEKKLGAQARISTKGQTAKSTSRSLVTAQATSGSSGISTASLSRDVGGAGNGIKGVGFERVESAIGSDFFGEERPLSGGPGPSRTDEEIQIVFDRYKAALYRIYNRELRKNPTLQGKVVIRLTIQPDGAVSACNMESSDMDSPALEKQIVDRVLKFNFGAKEGVTAVTILYPIDFLPAS